MWVYAYKAGQTEIMLTKLESIGQSTMEIIDQNSIQSHTAGALVLESLGMYEMKDMLLACLLMSRCKVQPSPARARYLWVLAPFAVLHKRIVHSSSRNHHGSTGSVELAVANPGAIESLRWAIAASKATISTQNNKARKSCMNCTMGPLTWCVRACCHGYLFESVRNPSVRCIFACQVWIASQFFLPLKSAMEQIRQ